VIHHFISPERRVAAIEEILRVVRVQGRVLIFVWALEQTGKRDFDKDVQDVFVPWAMPKKAEPKKEKSAKSRPQGVKKKDRKEASSSSTSTEDQIGAIAESMEQLAVDITTTTNASSSSPTSTSTPTYPAPSETTDPAPVYNRYYHLFQKGELEELITRTNKATIIQQGYDRDNWWCIVEKMN